MGSLTPNNVAPGGLVLVTGVNGFLAAHLAINLVERGYKVRGTVRSQEKADWITEAVTKRYPEASFEALVVPNISAPGAFEEAVRGVDGIAHVASDLTFGNDPNKVITPMLEALHNILSSAAKEPTVKRFVLTSSAIACLTPQPEKEIHVDTTTWNDSSIERAWAPPPYEPERCWDVYAALKTSTEREFWKFVQESRPGFVANAVLPDFIVGPIVHAKQNGSTGRWVKEFFDDPVNYYKPLQTFIPRHWVDVTDVALLHIAGLTEVDVQNERLLAFAGPFNFNSWLSVFRKIDPSKPWPADDPEQVNDRSTVDTERSKEILKRYSRVGFTSFFDSVRDNCLKSDPEWKRSNFP
ncbi:aldehyde reductase II [Aspergillus clavatus NRRL 1]|uniref:Aldehyde reductase II n=1 Tax=Aspergillus clavatus (strain ATCC 1007 / CBS 513.65 / DSM 816 / NCTC 3887 / NRRL 1 / QM 1276 / 107) TaxID=344612 RepID=A1CLQ7_ASPCL|nr:aldehyde reductase II [Aspergillus clavatus NRRL 1]EAW09036.1 aldehyde reductase II [Aspergillus clavatus NRRL 1]